MYLFSPLVFTGLEGKDARMPRGLSGTHQSGILGIRYFLKKALVWLKIKVDGQMGREMYG